LKQGQPEYIGDTRIVPHGLIDNGKLDEGFVAPGIVTEALADIWHEAPGPLPTSENWKANCAVAEGPIVVLAGGAFAAGGVNETERPSTIVSASGLPLELKSVMVGYPVAVQVPDPLFLTMTVPTMVPAAPVVWPGDADI